MKLLFWMCDIYIVACLTINNFKSIHERRIMFAVLERLIHCFLDSCRGLATVAMEIFRKGTI